MQLLCLPSSTHFHHPRRNPLYPLSRQSPFPPSPKSLGITNLLSVSIVWCIPVFHRKMKSDIMWAFCLVSSLTIMFLRVTQAVAGVSASLLFIAALISHCTDMPQFHLVCPFISWWTFGLSFAFRLLWSMLLWRVVYKLSYSCFKFFGYIPGVELLGVE